MRLFRTLQARLGSTSLSKAWISLSLGRQLYRSEAGCARRLDLRSTEGSGWKVEASWLAPNEPDLGISLPQGVRWQAKWAAETKKDGATLDQQRVGLSCGQDRGTAGKSLEESVRHLGRQMPKKPSQDCKTVFSYRKWSPLLLPPLTSVPSWAEGKAAAPHDPLCLSPTCNSHQPFLCSTCFSWFQYYGFPFHSPYSKHKGLPGAQTCPVSSCLRTFALPRMLPPTP